MSSELALAAGAIAAFLAVAFGAFGAHALDARLGERGRGLWHVAERYQFVHALALLLVGLLHGRIASGLLAAAGTLFVVGIVLFSGSLYALGLGAPRRTGLLTPLGGLAFLAGWVVLAAAAISGV